MIAFKAKNITIRDWEASDFDAYRHWNQGNHEWMKFNGPYYPQKTEAAIENDIQTIEKQLTSGVFPNIRHRLVIADNKSNTLIGTVSWYWQSEETDWLSIGIAIYDDNYWGKGIGFEALHIWMQYLFTNVKKIVRLDLRTWSGNIGMMKLAEKLGFTLEARFRKARIVEGKYYDSIGYGILREEFLKNSH